MRPQRTSEENRATAVNPAPRPRAPWRVEAVEALPDFRLKIRFLDGLEGEADLSRFIRSPEAGVFATLGDVSLFMQAFVELGAVTWPNGLDLAPDAMHHAIETHGFWTP